MLVMCMCVPECEASRPLCEARSLIGLKLFAKWARLFGQCSPGTNLLLPHISVLIGPGNHGVGLA